MPGQNQGCWRILPNYRQRNGVPAPADRRIIGGRGTESAKRRQSLRATRRAEKAEKKSLADGCLDVGHERARVTLRRSFRDGSIDGLPEQKISNHQQNGADDQAFQKCPGYSDQFPRWPTTCSSRIHFLKLPAENIASRIAP